VLDAHFEFFFAGEVVMITVAFLIVLFSLQRFGTSKVGLAVGPTLFIWFCCLSGIGIYNIMTYGSEVLRAFNPIYIYYYFERNPPQAWMSLGGCLLCATGIYFDCTVNIIFGSCF
jgi:K+ transporter